MTKKKIIIFVLISVVLLSFLLISIYKRRFVPIYTETFLNPTSEQLESYRNVYRQEPVKYLRQALNAYLANDSKNICIIEPAIQKSTSPKDIGQITGGLNSFDKKIYEGKFIVLSYLTPENSGFGDNMYHIQVLFKEYPYRVFYALLGKFEDEEICLLGFSSDEEMTGFKLQETLLPLKNFLDYEDLAM